MKFFIKALFFILFFTSFFSCNKHKISPLVCAYNWELGVNDYTKYDTTILKLKLNEIFIKILDIDWDDNYKYYPIATKYFEDYKSYKDSSILNTRLNLCVFITNKVFEKIDSNDISDLAKKVYLKTKQISSKEHTKFYVNKVFESKINSFKELQIDCDWTEKTAPKYFKFLSILKSNFSNVNITSTLRLHQYKYRTKMGIPPVNEVYLMCYNMGRIKDINEPNSIYNNQNAKQYFTVDEKYPLKLNYALPVFDWAILYRNNSFYALDNEFDESVLLEPKHFQNINKTNKYLAIRDTTIHNNFIRAGDIIKYEKTANEDLINAANLCNQTINSINPKIVFYDLKHLNKVENETIKKVINIFSN